VLVPILIMLLVLGALAGYVISNDDANRAAAARQVTVAFEAHLGNFTSENLTSTVYQYENNATLTVEGDDEKLGGVYDEAASITTFYQYVYSDNVFGTIALKNSTYSVDALNGQKVNVKSEFTLQGVSDMYSIDKGETPTNGTYAATVSLETSYVRSGTEWFISSETWDFLSFDLAA